MEKQEGGAGVTAELQNSQAQDARIARKQKEGKSYQMPLRSWLLHGDLYI